MLQNWLDIPCILGDIVIFKNMLNFNVGLLPQLNEEFKMFSRPRTLPYYFFNLPQQSIYWHLSVFNQDGCFCLIAHLTGPIVFYIVYICRNLCCSFLCKSHSSSLIVKNSDPSMQNFCKLSVRHSNPFQDKIIKLADFYVTLSKIHKALNKSN